MSVTSTKGKKLESYGPRYYLTSRVMQGIRQGQGTELDMLFRAVQETLLQAFVNTTTWGMDRWESEFGIEPNPSLSETERRERVMAKIKGVGTVTVSLLADVAESFNNGAVYTEQDHPKYSLILHFAEATGIPSNMVGFEKAIRELIPAHLVFSFEYRYIYWDILDGFNWTWDHIDGLNLTWDDLENYVW
jgi:uncharacterized protein YmfQ (DUF2313 family)